MCIIYYTLINEVNCCNGGSSVRIKKEAGFTEWHAKLTTKEQLIVNDRLRRVEDLDYLGDVESLSDGLYELRWKNGWRVYFIKDADRKGIILLLGGIKMSKKRISTKRGFSLEDLEEIKWGQAGKKRARSLPEVDTKSSFRDTGLVGKALLKCLIDNDPENYMNVLDSFVEVNKKRVAEGANIARATVHNAFSKKGNPTLKTIAKIVHEAVKSKAR